MPHANIKNDYQAFYLELGFVNFTLFSKILRLIFETSNYTSNFQSKFLHQRNLSVSILLVVLL